MKTYQFEVGVRMRTRRYDEVCKEHSLELQFEIFRNFEEWMKEVLRADNEVNKWHKKKVWESVCFTRQQENNSLFACGRETTNELEADSNSNRREIERERTFDAWWVRLPQRKEASPSRFRFDSQTSHGSAGSYRHIQSHNVARVVSREKKLTSDFWDGKRVAKRAIVQDLFIWYPMPSVCKRSHMKVNLGERKLRISFYKELDQMLYRDRKDN